jgi:serine/threonine-protein kinase
LIKRIGYLSNEKALELARQLVAGVAMAHDKGVLHRDLKPANIMIDGHGRVRITDFGLAVAAGDETGSAQVFGTPAYMAPEQFAGQSASVRSDIYALGLILYEIYTGKKAFTASTIAELRAQKEGPAPTAPSEIREGVDPLVERIIMRCLDRDPRSRPQSAVQLAASLPGGDPLAAAIAAGETPSPEMVAASGLKEGIRPAAAVALLAVVMAGAFAAIAMNKSAMLYPRAGLEKAPEVLVERSRNLIKKLGYAEAPADSAFGFGVNPEALRYIVNNDNSPNRWDKLEALNAVTFWYRQSLHPIERKTIFAPAPGMEIWFDDPPLIYPGDALVTLDGAGRLRGLTMVTRAAGAPRGPSDPDWSVLFAEAGLDPGTFKSVGPPGIPSFYADTRASWQGLMPNGPDVPVTIEAAAFEGKPVAFRIDSPWSADSTAPILQGNAVWVGALSVAVLFAVIGGGVFLARRNIRLGRGDRRGAMRLILFNGSLGAFGWILNEHHVAGFGELPLVLTFICGALFASGFMWTLYIGLEPFARRRWPHMLISWSRLLAGEWRDPLVGRDVLLGCAAGVTAACLFRLAVIAQSWFGGQPTGAPFWFVSTPFLGTRPFIGGLIGVLGAAIGFSLGYLLILFFFRALFRKDRLAFAATVLVMGTVNPLQPGESGMPWLDWVIALMFAALLYLVLFRAGLVATVVMNMVNTLFSSFPMTFDTSAWYSSIGFAALAVVMALSLYGFRTSLGSRPLFEPKLEL